MLLTLLELQCENWWITAGNKGDTSVTSKTEESQKCWRQLIVSEALHRTPNVQPVAQRYTDWATTALVLW
jgi:hypothetical protein